MILLHSLHTLYISILTAVLAVEYRLGKKTDGPGSIIEAIVIGAGSLVCIVELLKGKKK